MNIPKVTAISYQSMLRHVSLPQRTMGRMLPFFENNLARTKFLQDVATTWLPKICLTRSLAELNESTYLEFIENAMVYYGVTGMGQRVFKPLFMSQATQKIPAKLMNMPLEDLLKKHPNMVGKILPVKAAIIIASLGITTMAGEIGALYIKNMMTEKLFRKDRFSDIVNLSHGKVKTPEESPVWKKARKRLFQLGGISAVILAGCLALSQFGSRLKFLRPTLEKLVHLLDFDYEANGKFKLTRPLIRLYMGISLMGYLDAARDRLERLEILTRTPMLMLFISSGSEMIEQGLSQFVKNKCPDVMKNDEVKSINEITKMLAHNTLSTQAAQKKFSAILKAKNTLFYLPLAISILVPGIGLILLTRFWTAYRFKHHAQEALIRRSNTPHNVFVASKMPQFKPIPVNQIQNQMLPLIASP